MKSSGSSTNALTPLAQGLFSSSRKRPSASACKRSCETCKQTVDCRNQMGLALPEDPYTVCMDDTADLLSKDSARQQRFLTNYSRCSAFVVCEFYNCANANTVAYGESQRAKVTYDCQQAIACNTAFGMAPPNVGLALDSCVSQNIGLLDSYAAEKRASFENAYAMCSTLSGCDFRNCFVY